MVRQLKLTFILGLTFLVSTQSRSVFAQGIEQELLRSKNIQPQISFPLLAQANTSYKKAEEELGEEWYPLYRITEKLIRANGLTDKPWRIALLPENKINAFATEVNFVAVYAGLVDQVYGDSSALACAVSHEIAHHTQRHIPGRIAATTEEAQALEKKILKSEKNAKVSSAIFGGGSSIVGGSSVGNIVSSIIRGSARSRQRKKLKAFNARQIERSHNNEFEADEHGFLMMTKAGFDPQGCVRMLTVVANTAGGELDGDSHPSGVSRVERMKELIAENSVTALKNEGLQALKVNPNPLSYGKSAGGDSIRINSKFGDKWEY